MLFIIGGIISFLVISMFLKNFKFLFKIYLSINLLAILLFAVVWLILELDGATITIGIIIFLALGAIGIIQEQIGLKDIKKSLKENDVNLAIKSFYSTNEDGKKSIVNYLSKEERGQQILDAIFVSEVLEFGYQNSANKDLMIFEREKLEHQHKKVWKSCPDFSFNKIKNTLNTFRPDLEVNQESPKDTKTGKVIHLVRIEKKSEVGKLIIDIDLDDDE